MLSSSSVSGSSGTSPARDQGLAGGLFTPPEGVHALIAFNKEGPLNTTLVKFT